MTNRMKEKKNNKKTVWLLLPVRPATCATEPSDRNNVTGVKSASGYCFFRAPV